MSDEPLVNAELRMHLEAKVVENIDRLLEAVDAVNSIVATSNQDIHQAPAPHIKSLARELRKTARQVLRLSRLAVVALNSPDVGDPEV